MAGPATSAAPFECHVCDKSFGRRDLRDRHRRRCERTFSQPRKSKRKSCLTCATSKVACDLRQPSCSRCLARDVSCQYDADQALRISQSRSPEVDNLGDLSVIGRPVVTSKLPRSSLSIPNTGNELHHLLGGSAMPLLFDPEISVDTQAQPETHVIATSTMPLSSRPFSETGSSLDAWRETWTEGLDTCSDGPQGLFMHPDHTHGRGVGHNPLSAPSSDTCLGIDLLASFGLPATASFTGQSAMISTTHFESLPWHPPLPWDGHSQSSVHESSNKRVLPSRNNERIPSTQLTFARSFRPVSNWNGSIPDSVTTGNDDDWVKLVYGYPQLMLKLGTYPPFVHHSVYRCSEGEILEPLAIAFCCLGAYNASLPTSRDFTYSLINKERDQLIASFPHACASMSDISVLASVHAMCIYQIIGFFGFNSNQATHAELQQPWLLKMTRYLARTHFSQKPPDEEPTWEAWSMNETIRRTIFLVNAINCLSSRVGRQTPFFYEPLDNDLLLSLAPPAPACLWKAKSASEWENEHILLSKADLRILETTSGELLDATMSGHATDTHQIEGTAQIGDRLPFDELEQFTRLVLVTLRNTLG